MATGCCWTTEKAAATAGAPAEISGDESADEDIQAFVGVGDGPPLTNSRLQVKPKSVEEAQWQMQMQEKYRRRCGTVLTRVEGQLQLVRSKKEKIATAVGPERLHALVQQASMPPVQPTHAYFVSGTTALPPPPLTIPPRLNMQHHPSMLPPHHLHSSDVALPLDATAYFAPVYCPPTNIGNCGSSTTVPPVVVPQQFCTPAVNTTSATANMLLPAAPQPH